MTIDRAKEFCRVILILLIKNANDTKCYFQISNQLIYKKLEQNNRSLRQMLNNLKIYGYPVGIYLILIIPFVYYYLIIQITSHFM